jgi:hypothetical protein
VSGRVIAPPGETAGITVRLVPADGLDDAVRTFEELTATAGVDGRFNFPAVPAGQYRLQSWRFPTVTRDASQLQVIRVSGISMNIPTSNRTGRPLPPPPPDPVWVADVPIAVDRAVTGLAVPLQPGARITGRVIFEGDGPRPTGDELLASPVVPVPAFDRLLGVVPGSRIEADGSFATVGLPPGRYALRVGLTMPAREPDAGWYPLPLTTRDGRVLAGRAIDVGTSDVDVTVRYARRSARLSVTVRDANGRPVPDAWVIMFARDPEQRGYGLTGVPGCVIQTAPNREGRLEIALPPSCEFLVAAVMNRPRLWMAPEYLEALVPFAVPANLVAGATRTIDLVARP